MQKSIIIPDLSAEHRSQLEDLKKHYDQAKGNHVIYKLLETHLSLIHEIETSNKRFSELQKQHIELQSELKDLADLLIRQKELDTMTTNLALTFHSRYVSNSEG